jgi:hypothetical protein
LVELVENLPLSVSQMLLPNRRGIASMGSTDDLCSVDAAWTSCLGGGGVKDRPPNLGAQSRFVASVLGADEEVLANGPIDGDRVLCDVGGQSAVGQVEVAVTDREVTC